MRTLAALAVAPLLLLLGGGVTVTDAVLRKMNGCSIYPLSLHQDCDYIDIGTGGNSLRITSGTYMCGDTEKGAWPSGSLVVLPPLATCNKVEATMPCSCRGLRSVLTPCRVALLVL